MRGLLCVGWVVGLAMFASAVRAQTDVDSEWTCAKPMVTHTLDAGDKAGHAFVLNKVKCTANRGVIDEVAEMRGESTEFHEVLPSESRWRGMFVDTLASGDRLHISFEGSGKLESGALKSGANNWSIVGGTGKYDGATGTGRCDGRGEPDGSTTWTCRGTLRPAKPGKN